MIPTLFALCLLQEPIPAKTLQGVPGPVAPTWADPARGDSAGGMQLGMRRSARRGTVPTVALPPGFVQVTDEASAIPGWKGYRAEVPPGTSLHVRLRGVHEAWFRVSVVDRWGQVGEGMLHNRIPTGNPEASYRNAGAQPRTVYFIVDTTNDSVQGETYTLHLTPGPLPEGKPRT